DELWWEPHGCVSTGWRLRRPNSQGREASRPASHAADEIRTGHQSANRQGAAHRNSANAARPRRRGDRVRRRDFIKLLGGAAAAWPLLTSAQQPDRLRRIGVLMSVADAPEGQARLAAFLKGLHQWGWTEGRNVRIDTRWGGGDAERTRKNVAELLSLGPDVFLASGDHPVVD